MFVFAECDPILNVFVATVIGSIVVFAIICLLVYFSMKLLANYFNR